MKRTIAILALSTVAILSLSACVFAQSGPKVTETREISDVEAIALETSGDVTITLGSTPSLSITAGADVQKRLTSDVVDGVLVLGTTPGAVIGAGEIRYTLTVTRIQSVSIDGSGDVEADFAGSDDVVIEVAGSGEVDGVNVAAQTLSVSIDGSGGVELTGTVADQSIVIDGSGDYDGSDLESSTGTVDIGGSGSVDVRVTDTLAVDISGSGDVTHTGGATVTQEISGSGSVSED